MKYCKTHGWSLLSWFLFVCGFFGFVFVWGFSWFLFVCLFHREMLGDFKPFAFSQHHLLSFSGALRLRLQAYVHLSQISALGTRITSLRS